MEKKYLFVGSVRIEFDSLGGIRMLKKVVYTTDTHEIQIKETDNKKWELNVYDIKHGAKEISEKHELDHYRTAIIYVEENYLKKNRAVI